MERQTVQVTEASLVPGHSHLESAEPAWEEELGQSQQTSRVDLIRADDWLLNEMLQAWLNRKHLLLQKQTGLFALLPGIWSTEAPQPAGAQKQVCVGLLMKPSQRRGIRGQQDEQL